MKRPVFNTAYLCIIGVLFFWSAAACAEEPKKADPNQLFYAGNSHYENRNYTKAIEEYLKIRDANLKSGGLYYNIGNGFLKLGKVGYAILFYEKAKRLMPRDSDLRSNLAYARSLVGNSDMQIRAQKKIIIKIINRPFIYLTLNAIAISAAILYLTLIAVQTIFILSPRFKNRFGLLFPAVLILFLLNLTALSVRYYEERILARGVVIRKETECKYEPIDSSTTYYTLPEGSDCYILKTRNGWRQIKRPDGRIGWVKRETVEGV